MESMPDASEKDLAKDGLLAIAPRDPSGRPTLGGIPLYRKLGQGGMGAVYLGKHPRLGVEVAVKILPFHLADQDPNAIEYFMREANVAARLNHPNLVRIFDVNVDGDPKAGSAIWYLVMEFVAGKTAGRLIKDRVKSGQGPLPEADALDLLLTVSDGLAAAHEERFVHRDIKPENIIIPLSAEGEPQYRKAKLMDLGLAKVHSEDLSLGLTGTNVAMGTPGYMAPEQAENAKGAGPSADIFAMGATLYNLLTGAAPFTGTTVLNVLKKTSDEPHVPVRQINPSVSRPTDVLIDTCLAKRPEARYANAGILREGLKACRQSLGGESTTEFTLASLQNLASISAAEVTLRSDAASVLPSTPARPAVTSPSPPAPAAAASIPIPARKSKAPILIAVAAVLALVTAAGIGGIYLLQKLAQNSKGSPPAPPVVDTPGTEFAGIMKEAEAALADEDFAKAERLFKKARDLKPQSSEAQDGERRARELREQESSVAKAAGEADALVRNRNFQGAWDKLRAGIDLHPTAIILRLAAARLALDHGTYDMYGLALNDVNQAIRLSGPKRKGEAISLRDKLDEKKKQADQAGGVLPQIQLAIDQGDWEAAEKLLERVDPAQRAGFSRSIEQGRKWQAALARGKKAEASQLWPEALAAYQEAYSLKADSATEALVRKAEEEVRSLYAAECDKAVEKARAGNFDEARKYLAEAEKLLPSGARHGKIRDENRFLEHLAEARRFKGDGKRAEALAAAQKALALRGDSAEARAIVDELKGPGSLGLAKAALAGGDRAAAVRHARAAAVENPGAPELKDLESDLWADLYVEKAAAAAKGPVDELSAAADGRVVGIGAGFGSFAVWGAEDLKLDSPPVKGGPKPFYAALIEKDGLRLAGLTGPAGIDGPETEQVAIWENGKSRHLHVETSGLKVPVTATRLAPFDGFLVLRVRLTPGDDRGGTDVYTLDVLDTEKSGAGNPTSDRGQAHGSIAVPPAGSYFATGGGTYRTWKREGNKSVVDERKNDTQVYLWARDTFAKRPVDLGEAVGDGALLSFTPDGAKLLVATLAKKLFVIDAAGGRVERSIPLPESPTGLSVSAAGAAVVAGRRVFLVRLGDARVAPATGFAAARSVLCAADGASVFVGGDDGLLRRYAYEPLAK